MRRQLPVHALLPVLLLSFATATALANGVGVLSRHGDKLTAVISEDGDEDAFAVELAEGGNLSVAVKAAKGVTLIPTIRVFRPDGTEADVTALIKKPGTPKPALKKFLADRTGIFKVLIAGDGGTTGGYTAIFKIKNPKAYKERAVTVPAGGTREFEFTAAAGALMTVIVKEKDGPELAGLRVLDPDGGEEAAVADFTRKNTKLSLKKLPLTGPFGTFVLELGGAAGATTVDVIVKVKPLKTAKRKETLPPEATLASLAPGVVRQEGVGTVLALSGANFLAGSTAAVSGDGVTVTGVVVEEDGMLLLAPASPEDLVR